MIYIYKLCDLHAIFLFQIISFKKYFYVSLGNNFYCFLVEAPYLCMEAPGQLPSLPPPIKPGPAARCSRRYSES